MLRYLIPRCPLRDLERMLYGFLPPLLLRCSSFHLACLSVGSKGHEMVAAIAETQLSDTTRTRIKELLPQRTDVS